MEVGTYHLCPGRSGGWLHMNWSSLRYNRLKFKTSWKLMIILEESMECALNERKRNRKMSTCYQLDLESPYLHQICPKYFPGTCYHFTRVPSLKFQAWRGWRSAWQHCLEERFMPVHGTDVIFSFLFFGGEAWDLCWELGQGKSWTRLSTRVPWLVSHKMFKIQLWWQVTICGFSRLRSWNFCRHVGTCYHKWDLGPRVNQPLTYLPCMSYSTPTTQPKARPPLVVDEVTISRTMPLVW